MPIILDETTRAEYLAQTVASTRAAIIVGAFTGTVVVEVFDGSNVLRANGTMAPPWATSSGATITVGEVNALGLTVTSGGTPTADWYCQFRAGARLIRGTFGVAGSGRDFTWSQPSFDTGSRGTIGTVLVAAAGDPDVIAPVSTAAPTITGVAQVGFIVTSSAGAWANQPSAFTIQWQRATTFGGTYSAISGATSFSYAPVAGDVGFFLRAQVVASNSAGSAQAFSNVVGAVQAAAVASETLSVAPNIATFNGTAGSVGTLLMVNPGRWVNDRPLNQYPIQQRFQWNRDGVPIINAIGLSYTTQAADAGKTITVTETVSRVASLNTTTSTVTAGVAITGTRDSALVYQDDVEWLGCFQLPYPSGAPNDSRSFAYGGALAFNPAGNGGAGSLFIGGHFDAIQIGEVSIPALSTTQGGMQTATLLTGATLVDPTEGRARNRGVYNSGLMGLHVNGSNLYITEVQGYSANRATWMYRRPLNLATTGAVEGPFAVADYARGSLNADNPRALSGVMANVPSAHQTALGGEVITGLVADSIVSVASDGPSVAGFNPASVTSAASLVRSGACQGGTSTSITLDAGASATNGAYVNCYVTVPSQLVRSMKITAYNGTTKVATVDGSWVHEETGAGVALSAGATYHLAAAVQANASVLYGNGALQSSEDWTYPQVWNHTGTLRGLAVPNGTRSVLAIGRRGNGFYAYGAQDEIIAGIRIYDPDGEGRGERSFPYLSQIWGYDINTLNSARTGAIALSAVKPYTTFHLFAPIAWKGYPGPGGAAYDPATRRLYVLANWALNFGNPAVHVFRINNAIVA